MWWALLHYWEYIPDWVKYQRVNQQSIALLIFLRQFWRKERPRMEAKNGKDLFLHEERLMLVGPLLDLIFAGGLTEEQLEGIERRIWEICQVGSYQSIVNKRKLDHNGDTDDDEPPAQQQCF